MAIKIERRRSVVTLYQGNYEHRLRELFEEALSTERMEQAVSSRRMSSKSKANELAKEYDKLLAEAEETAVPVTVWAIANRHWGPLADEHPPRDGEDDDQTRGINMKTFPEALMLASLVGPDEADTLDEIKRLGREKFDELGDLSRLHVAKIEHAAWDVNVGDEDLPKLSLVSLLKQQRELDSKLQDDLE